MGVMVVVVGPSSSSPPTLCVLQVPSRPGVAITQVWWKGECGISSGILGSSTEAHGAVRAAGAAQAWRSGAVVTGGGGGGILGISTD